MNENKLSNLHDTDNVIQGLGAIVLSFRPTTDVSLLIQDTPLFEGGLELDSVVLLEMISEIESRFGFAFQDTDLRTRTFQTLGTLSQVVLLRVHEPSHG